MDDGFGGREGDDLGRELGGGLTGLAVEMNM